MKFNSSNNQNRNNPNNAQALVAANIQFLVEQLEAGNSEALTGYLNAMARFHNYSFGNILLIGRQRPDASHVAGMYAWNQLGRRVKRGEKGIQIYAPMLGRRRKETANTDAKAIKSAMPQRFPARISQIKRSNKPADRATGPQPKPFFEGRVSPNQWVRAVTNSLFCASAFADLSLHLWVQSPIVNLVNEYKNHPVTVITLEIFTALL